MKLDGRLIAHTSPVAAKENIVYWRDYRITVLQSRLFRMEKNAEKIFRDDATQSVWFRDMPPQKFSVRRAESSVEIITEDCTLIVTPDRDGCRVVTGGVAVKIDNDGNLKGTYRTLDCCNGDFYNKYWQPDSPQYRITLGYGVCSESGVAVLDDAKSLTLGENGEVAPSRGCGADEYVFAYGRDYRAAVKALYMICGNVPMIPRYALGNWWSRYYKYSDREYLKLLNRFDEHDVPLTVAVMDMDWHYSDDVDKEKGITAQGKNGEYYCGNSVNIGWTGYSWNRKLFPDYKGFLNKLKKKNIKVTLNLHPADGVRWWEDCYADMAAETGRNAADGKKIDFDISDARFINAYFKVLHRPLEKDGVEFWWIDWQQGEKSAVEGLDPLWSLNHYHYLDHASGHAEPVILSRYAGVGSHRYPIGFSGDTVISWETLGYLPYFTLTASNIGYTWWSHDIGGHMGGKTDGELYLRHIQFGVFSPVNRLHSSNAVTTSKEPWVYGNGTGAIACEWLRLRHRMIPFLYSCAYRTHSEGLALIEPLYYGWSEECEAYARKNEYIFGENFLVAPVTSPLESDGYARTQVWLPEGRWTDVFTGDEYTVGKGGETKTLLRKLESIPVLARGGAVLPLSLDKGNSVGNPKRLEINVFKGSASFTLYENFDGKEAFTRFVTDETVSARSVVQKLNISFCGEGAVIPENRTLKLVFRNVSEGRLKLTVNGERKRAKRIMADDFTFEIKFRPCEVYEIELAYRRESARDRLLGVAQKILTQSECDNEIKFRGLWQNLVNIADERGYADVVNKSAVPEAVKERLLETIPYGMRYEK